MAEDFGGALTGLDPAEATSRWDDWLDRPGNRAGLLQFGLQLMQPVAMGQSVGGHIAQSIGAGGEAMTRAADVDRKDALAQGKLDVANERLRIAQQNADASSLRASTTASRAASRKVGGLTDMFRARMDRDAERDYERRLDRDAAAIAKANSDLDKDLVTGKERKAASQDYQKYGSKTAPEIRELLRKERPMPRSRYAAPSDDEDDSEDEVATTPGTATTTPAQAAPPKGYEDARQASDGQWYVQRNGKYYRVNVR